MVLSFSQPVKGNDGKDIHDVLVTKDTVVLASIAGVNRDPTIWGEDAMEWNPERFLKPLQDSVTDARIPGVYANLYVLFTSVTMI